ncbi:hypothetical protein [Blastococcus brunescens]|uniref:Uncharacterized protein n=1 Tax=Blastococcus brunescens TaxID=1564165 RepID=A0ABZ1B744_9ACTN|nr:hypothetical protein [Blastococcus sp. BMG 8361]WRL65209.1 hypothetical protein U6N30_05955 [Blastococcus sp. BMG 8361]
MEHRGLPRPARRPGDRRRAHRPPRRAPAPDARRLRRGAETCDDDWHAASSLNDWALRLSPTRARQLVDELNGVLQRWRDEEEEPDEPLVHVLLDLFPLRNYPL